MGRFCSVKTKYELKSTPHNCGVYFCITKTTRNVEAVDNAYDVDLAIGNIIDGKATFEDFKLFAPENTANRRAFYEATGIKLPIDSRLTNYSLLALNNKNRNINNLYTNRKIPNAENLTLTDYVRYIEKPNSLTVADEDGIIETENVELRGFYEYKDKVEEATIEDYKAYKAVKATGVKGTIRVPPKHIDISVLEFNDEHAKNHGCNLEDAIRYIENAKCSISRKRWDGTHTNYYSFDGAAYVDNETNKIKTVFSKSEFDQITDGIMEVFK